MEMPMIYGILIMIGLHLFVVLWCKWMLKTEQKRGNQDAASDNWYDERQMLAHGKAYRLCTSVAAIYLLGAYVLYKFQPVFEWDLFIDPSILMIGGFWLLLFSYHLCCLLTDSAIPLGDYNFPVALYIIVGAGRILTVLLPGILLGVPLTIEKSEEWEGLIFGFAFLAIGIVHLIAKRRNKRASDEE